MEENSKHTNGIGHNSKLNEVDYYGQPPITKAALELVEIAKDAAEEALAMLEEVKLYYASAFKGEKPLTEEEQNINFKSQQYNKNILQNQHVFKTEKLRKIIKPKRLSAHEKHELFHKGEELYGNCWMKLNDADGSLRQVLDKDDILDMLTEDEVKKVTKGEDDSN